MASSTAATTAAKGWFAQEKEKFCDETYSEITEVFTNSEAFLRHLKQEYREWSDEGQEARTELYKEVYGYYSAWQTSVDVLYSAPTVAELEAMRPGQRMKRMPYKKQQ